MKGHSLKKQNNYTYYLRLLSYKKFLLRWKNYWFKISGRWSYKNLQLKWDNYRFKISGTWNSCPLTCPINKPHHRHVFWSWFGSFLAIAATAYLSMKTNTPLLMAPFGATSVLIFGVPDSPLAQPRNVIGGNLLAAFISLTILHLFGSSPWTMGMAVSTTIAVMQMTGTLHPPAGAIALVVMMTNAPWEFLVTPALQGSIILVLCAVLFNNLAEERTYPKHWL
ncbi:HPP family protein [Microcoleus sp. FACHB-672]|uniref:HPP family protein n=1 Tax=Microcoleus sp. FACHB-672 TaxID=2692825 RepID=UPI001687021C|nr:HPP family protein [Microcoleus sp. FACHB-672]MBD2043422.1 HPP family protein [Microcoleus sp. FACHB-672]